jgi:hypothetical protein
MHMPRMVALSTEIPIRDNTKWNSMLTSSKVDVCVKHWLCRLFVDEKLLKMAQNNCQNLPDVWKITPVGDDVTSTRQMLVGEGGSLRTWTSVPT